MLGGRGGQAAAAAAAPGRAGEPPTYRVPGASVAATATAPANNGRTTWAGAARRAAPSGAAAPAQGTAGGGGTSSGGDGAGGGADDDGFQPVVRRGRRAGANATAVGDTDARDDRRPSDNDGLGGGEGGRAEGGVDEADEGEDDGQPSVADLQQAWRDEVVLIRKLRGQGVQDGHPAMRAACEARDAAERAWRGSKQPAPQAVRLGRAQAKLDRAVVLQSEARQAILDEERAHRERLAALQETMDACTERVALRRRQVQEVQDEVGAAGRRGAGSQRAQEEAIKVVHGTICDDVGPSLAALAEQVGTETPAWAALNAVLAKLADSKATLENATARHATRFDIGDGTDQWEEGTEWSESHDVQGQRWGQGDADRALDRCDDDAPCDGADDDAMETDDWWGTPARRWGATARWQPSGHCSWTKSSWADQLEEEGGAGGGGDGQPPTARRRLGERVGEETQQARPTPPPQPVQPAPQATPVANPSDDVAERQRKHTERVNHITALAVESGVTPLTSSGEELFMLGPEQLEEWVAACLPSALLC